MSRTIQLHPLSVLVGLGIALLGLVAMGQMAVPSRTALAHSSMFRQVAHPRDWVVIKEGVPFLVPPGRILVLTGVGATKFSSCAFGGTIRIDGSDAAEGSQYDNNGDASVHGLPVGLSARAGSTVEIDACAAGAGRAWGYLVDA
jgi:hypothetical protein